MWVCSTKWKKFGGKKCELDMHSVDDLVMCLVDINGHISRHLDGGNGLGQRNLEGRMLLEFCL